MNDLSATLYKTLPRSIRVGCYTFRIEVGEITDHEAEGTFGHMNPVSQKIRVRPGMMPHNLANTVIHEILHCIHWVYGLNDHSDEETFTTQTANGLCAFWQDNERLCSWWKRALASDPA